MKKFDALIESLLSEASAVSGEKLYSHESPESLRWLRKGGNLKGAPKDVKGYFNCSYRHLDTLWGGPETVGEGYYCQYNALINLIGAPAGTIKGNFDCSHNCLETLDGAPELVEEYFDCDHNPLKSLAGVPEAKSYFLPQKFTPAGARKEVARRKFEKGLDKETADTFGDFVNEL